VWGFVEISARNIFITNVIILNKYILLDRRKSKLIEGGMYMELSVIMFGGVFTIALCVYLIKKNQK